MAQLLAEYKSARIFTLFAVLCFTPLCYAADIEFVTASSDQYSHPHDITLNPSGTYLFVADMDNDTIKILDPLRLTEVGELGRGELNGPHDVAFDAQGRLIIADSGNNRLLVYTLNGLEAKKSTALTNAMRSPEGVAASKHGDLYIANTGSHNIVQFKDITQNNVINKTGNAGRGESDFIRPHDVEIHDNRLYATDPGNNRIKILNLDLQTQRILSGPPYDFNEPKYLALDEQGRLYVADQHNNRIQIFAAYPAHDTLLASITAYTIGERTYTLNKPEGVEVHGEHIWISDTYNNRILLFRWVK